MLTSALIAEGRSTLNFTTPPFPFPKVVTPGPGSLPSVAIGTAVTDGVDSVKLVTPIQVISRISIPLLSLFAAAKYSCAPTRRNSEANHASVVGSSSYSLYVPIQLAESAVAETFEY